jgi:two-component system phosphate regulon response regulator PhoB
MADERKTVLFVEDDDDSREALTEILAAEGYRVLSASDGLEAFARMIAGASPSVIVLDVMLPLMNGIEFLLARRLRPDLGSAPVILLSGMGDDLDGLRGTFNVREFLRKPVDPKRLIDAVRQFA